MFLFIFDHSSGWLVVNQLTTQLYRIIVDYATRCRFRVSFRCGRYQMAEQERDERLDCLYQDFPRSDEGA